MRATMIRTLVVSILAILSVSATDIPPSTIKRVAVVDTGLDLSAPWAKPYLCPNGHRDFTGTGITDKDGHGSHVTNLIIQNAKGSNFCLVILKFYTNTIHTSWNRALMEALEYIKEERIPIANLSLSGPGFMSDEDRYFASNSTTLFITAAGNNGVNLDEEPYYPASYTYSNILVVGALNKYTGKRLEISNYGRRVTLWEKEDATSYATAVKTGKIVKEGIKVKSAF